MASKKKYNFYDDAFKATAVALTEMPGVMVRDVADVLDSHVVMFVVAQLIRWPN